ncbi:MAG: CHAT domain-containing protein, partial [Anaerolineales bacterium]|nr:CHAT domain-containing protein [Anaerolineales bacterium]
MTHVTITQTDKSSGSPFAASVQFNSGPRYPISVSDPFSEEEEERLQWYYEGWLSFPFTGQVKAAQAAASVADYGRRLFAQVFRDNPDVLAEYKMAMRYEQGFAGLEFEIRGTPAFHALHWEALWDPANGRPFAAECAFYRQNDNPPAFHIRPQPSPTLNVLLVTARPRGRQDVGYRTISRPLVDALHTSALRTQIDIVRPGSYAALVRHLERSRDRHGDGYYHIIHFDVHGSLLTFAQYQKLETGVSPHLFKGGYGQPEITPYDGLRAFLSFNGAAAGEHDLVADEVIAGLLQSHQIPIAILNACQSGMQVGDSETSLGSRLMAAGVQTAVAMAYSVTVSAARRLMTHLYQHLLAGLPLPQAIRRARLELLNVKERRAAYNQTIELEDWLLPVVYQNQPVALPITDFASAAEEEAYLERQSRRYRAPKPTYGFVGRDVDILEMETRLLTRDDGDPAAAGHAANVLLLQGMGGAGKTTLLKHLMEWWQTTRLVARVFYFGYDEKAYTTGQILDGIARELYGMDYGRLFSPLSDAAKQQKLAAALRSERHLLVLDNLESITGTALAIQHTLDAAEQDRLRDFVARLAGGQTLVLLGSRGTEEWLVGSMGSPRYELPGLDPEAASALAQCILNALGLRDLPADPAHGSAFRQLLKLLDGYPLALEIVLANLARQTPADLLAAFSGGDAGIDAAAGGDLWQDKTKSLLRCIEYSHSNLSADAQALLACLAPFTGVFNANWLPQYTAQLKAQPALAALPYDRWQEVLTEALNWGLLTPHEMGGGYLRLQPILPYFLRQRLTAPSPAGEGRGEGLAIESAFRAHFDEVGGALAGLLKSKQPQERQLGQALTNLEYENLMTALKLALASQTSFYNFFNPLIEYHKQRQEHSRGIEVCELVLASQENYDPEQRNREIGVHFYLAYEWLATTNLLVKKYEEAKQAYQQALTLIDESQSIPTNYKGTIYHQLGMVA